MVVVQVEPVSPVVVLAVLLVVVVAVLLAVLLVVVEAVLLAVLLVVVELVEPVAAVVPVAEVTPVLPVWVAPVLEVAAWHSVSAWVASAVRPFWSSVKSEVLTLVGRLLTSLLAVAMSVVAAVQSCSNDIRRDPREVDPQGSSAGRRDQPAAAAAGGEQHGGGERRAGDRERPHWPYSSRSASESGRRAARIALAAAGMS